MDSDGQLRSEVVSALEAVTPPAPWLAATIGESLRVHPRRGGGKMVAAARFTARGLSVAVAVALVLLLGATAVGILALRSLVHPVPTHPGRGDLVRYGAMLTRDQQLLNEAAGHDVTLGSTGTACDTLAHTECPAFLSRVAGAHQRLLYDLDHTTPPAQFLSEHARMRADLQALITAISLGAAAFNAGDISTSNRVLGDGIQIRDDILTIEAYVVYESRGDRPARDVVTTAYTAMIGRDYDNLRLPALFGSLLSCTLADAACAAPAATTRSATQAFLADLRASTPPARFAAIHADLVTGLGAELDSLDQVDAARAAQDETGLGVARQRAINAHSRISTYAGGILYTH